MLAGITCGALALYQTNALCPCNNNTKALWGHTRRKATAALVSTLEDRLCRYCGFTCWMEGTIGGVVDLHGWLVRFQFCDEDEREISFGGSTLFDRGTTVKWISLDTKLRETKEKS